MEGQIALHAILDPIGPKDPNGFVKYSSLTNHYMDKVVEKFLNREPGLNDEEWIATEKIHGANFSWLLKVDKIYDITKSNITEDNITIEFCKRSGPISEDDKTFSHQIVIEKYKTKILNMALELIKEHGSSVVQVFGEIFGGWYNGKTAIGHKKLNSEVSYNDRVDFSGFDIRLNGGNFEGYLDKDTALNLFDKHKIYRVKILGRGKFNELRSIDPIFKTSVFKDFGLECDMKLFDDKDIFKNPYIAEGFVLTPIKSTYVGDHRVAIKCKNYKFSEKTSERSVKNLNCVSHEDADGVYSKLIDILDSYINKQRFDSVVSKLSGKILNNEMAIRGLVVTDAVEEMKQIFENEDLPKDTIDSAKEFLKFESKDVKKLKNLACIRYATEIKEWFKNYHTS